jgi:hypothetical protein
VHLVRRLAAELENQVAFNDYWQGQHWGNASN